MEEEYDKKGLPLDKDYMEHNLPLYLEISLEKIKNVLPLLDSDANYAAHMAYGEYYCELQSSINMAEVSQSISEEQAWYLREKYLEMERNMSI